MSYAVSEKSTQNATHQSGETQRDDPPGSGKQKNAEKAKAVGPSD